MPVSVLVWIGEAEGMSTCAAHILGEPCPAFDEAYEVASRHAGERMRHAHEAVNGLQERVTAPAGVLYPVVRVVTACTRCPKRPQRYLTFFGNRGRFTYGSASARNSSGWPQRMQAYS